MRTEPGHQSSGSHAWQEALPLAAKLPQLTLHGDPEQRILKMHWSEQNTDLSSVVCRRSEYGRRRQSLLEAGSGIAMLLGQRHSQGSLAIQLHDEDPLIPCLRLDSSNE